MTVDLFEITGPNSPALAPEERRLVERIERAVDDVAPIEDKLLDHSVDIGGEDVARERYPGRFENHGLPELDLPGFGEPYTGEEGQIPCGADIPHICSDCGHRIDIGRTCRRSVCPRCAPAWAMKTAIGHVGRLDEAARMMSSREGYDAVYKHHVIVGLRRPFLVDADDPLEEALHLIRDMMDDMDAEGFVYYHPYSGNQDHEDDRGKWKQRLFQDREWDDVREELEMRPHFHLVVVSPHIPGGQVTKAIYDRTGIIIHRVTERNGSPVSLADLDSVARAVTYCLSHTAIDTRGEGNNRAIMRCYGPAPHDCLPLNDDTVRKATRAVHKAAPDTLGLSTGSIECRAERPADEREVPEEYLSADDGDGEGAGLDETSSTTESNMVPCGSELRSIDDAEDLLKDDQWCTRARHVEEAREAKREWEAAGGWRGWVEWDPPPD